MVIGLLRIELFIHASLSLKSKRQVLKSLKERLRNSFNISVAEIGHHDKWQRSLLGIAYLGNDKVSVNSALGKVLNFVENVYDVEITECKMEVL